MTFRFDIRENPDDPGHAELSISKEWETLPGMLEEVGTFPFRDLDFIKFTARTVTLLAELAGPMLEEH
jgi:hypothetical protein